MDTIKNALTYDWNTWLMGIFRSIIGGGGGVLAAWVITAGDPLRHVLISMGEAFLISGLVHLGIFLETHNGPEIKP